MTEINNNPDFYLMKTGKYVNKAHDGEKVSRTSKVDVIETSDGTIWGVKYSDKDGNRENFEGVSVFTYTFKDGQLIRNNDEKRVSGISSYTKKAQPEGEPETISKEYKVVEFTDEANYYDEVDNKGLFKYLESKFLSSENNTGIVPKYQD